MASWKKSSRPSAISQLFKANFLTSFSRKSLFYFTRYYTSCIILSHLYFLFERVTQGLKQRSCVRFFKNQLAFEILNFFQYKQNFNWQEKKQMPFNGNYFMEIVHALFQIILKSASVPNFKVQVQLLQKLELLEKSSPDSETHTTKIPLITS